MAIVPPRPLDSVELEEFNELRKRLRPVTQLDRMEVFAKYLLGGVGLVTALTGLLVVFGFQKVSDQGKGLAVYVIAGMGISYLFAVVALVPAWGKYAPESPDSLRRAALRVLRARYHALRISAGLLGVSLCATGLIPLLGQREPVPALSIAYSLAADSALVVKAKGELLMQGDVVRVAVLPAGLSPNMVLPQAQAFADQNGVGEAAFTMLVRSGVSSVTVSAQILRDRTEVAYAIFTAHTRSPSLKGAKGK